MAKIRVMIVDDSVVIRKMLTDALHSDPNIEVTATAQNGKVALEKFPQVKPDLVVCDVEMPEMNGLDTVTEIRKIDRTTPIVMFSTLTDAGAKTTLESLARGATDYVSKPANVGSVSASLEKIRTELVPRILALGSKAAGIPLPGSPTPLTQSGVRPLVVTPGAGPMVAAPRAKPRRCDILAIGSSTGGPNALMEFLAGLGKDFALPVVIAQHMPATFTKILAERLAAHSRLNVKEGVTGGTLEPGTVWIAPGDFHMTVKRQGTSFVLDLNQNPPENSCRPAVDPLFRSVAETFGSAVIGVILTGMGQDGLKGCEQIHRAGGQIFVQDESSSVVWGMPGSVVNAGLAHGVHPLSLLSTVVKDCAGTPGVRAVVGG